MYTIKTNPLVTKLYPELTWQIPGPPNQLFLTFDDGPTPDITQWVLEELEKFNAQATFFLIGKNVADHGHLFQQVIHSGNAIGNHTYDHLNGWKTKESVYLDNISKAARLIPSKLFRPPFGKIRKGQVRQLADYKIIMWDILAGDFDRRLNKEKALEVIFSRTKHGSIIVMHDSIKAAENLYYLLPKILEHFSDKGFTFRKIKFDNGK